MLKQPPYLSHLSIFYAKAEYFIKAQFNTTF